MGRGKPLTRRQKILLTRLGLEPARHRILKELDASYIIMDVETKEARAIPKEAKDK